MQHIYQASIYPHSLFYALIFVGKVPTYPADMLWEPQNLYFTRRIVHEFYKAHRQIAFRYY